MARKASLQRFMEMRKGRVARLSLPSLPCRPWLPGTALTRPFDRSLTHAECPPVTCLAIDAVMSFGFDAGREIGVRVVVFLTISTCGLIEQGLVPFKHDCTRRTLRTSMAATSSPW